MKTKHFLLIGLFFFSVTLFVQGADDYKFDKTGVSRNVLENYLAKSITMTDLLTPPGFENDGAFSGKEDDIRMLRNIGVKFIGRSIYRWGKEDTLANKEFLDGAKKIADKIHEIDSDIIFQACLFEIVTQRVNSVPIPAWAFEALDMPVEKRNFDYDEMLALNKKMVNHWGSSSVPDITRPETQLWFLFLAGTYLEIGCEAFHLGQVELIGMNDPQKEHWFKFVAKLREFSSKKARRGWIILDAHTPRGGMVVGGKSLLDFNSFPLRIKDISDKPMQGVLEVGYLDSLFKRSEGCTTPSGWKCDSLPYLVEFDNFGITRTPGQATPNTHFIWGYDEISWFYQQSEEYRDEWLRYADKWVRDTDPNGFLQMPVGRVVSEPGKRVRFRANTKSETVPEGLNLEDTIKSIFTQK